MYAARFQGAWRKFGGNLKGDAKQCLICCDILLIEFDMRYVQCSGGKAKDAKRAAAKEKKAEKSGGLASMVSDTPEFEVAA